jgi:NAD-dependent dihydropyrimidine dehydrogenase PreA subunit
MPAVVDKEKCDGCKSCEEVCPTDSIKVGEERYALVAVDECIDCNACMDECPSHAIEME